MFDLKQGQNRVANMFRKAAVNVRTSRRPPAAFYFLMLGWFDGGSWTSKRMEQIVQRRLSSICLYSMYGPVWVYSQCIVYIKKILQKHQSYVRLNHFWQIILRYRHGFATDTVWNRMLTHAYISHALSATVFENSMNLQKKQHKSQSSSNYPLCESVWHFFCRQIPQSFLNKPHLKIMQNQRGQQVLPLRQSQDGFVSLFDHFSSSPDFALYPRGNAGSSLAVRSGWSYLWKWLVDVGSFVFYKLDISSRLKK